MIIEYAEKYKEEVKDLEKISYKDIDRFLANNPPPNRKRFRMM